MQPSTDLQPAIRVAHYYDFPAEKNSYEATRLGYCYAFHLIGGGKGKIAVAGQTFNVRKGDMLYFPPRLRHSFFSDPEQPLSSFNIYCELWQPAPAATHRHLEWNDSDYETTFLTEIRTDEAIERFPYFLPLQQHPTTIALFEHAVNHYQRADPLSFQIADILLKAFLLEFMQLSQAPLLSDFRIKAILDFIEQETHAGRHYERWLALSGLKKTQFHQLFKQATGLSPKAFWTRAIMKKAAAALRESNRSITDLANDLGYSSIHHFTKQFTAFYSISPTVFRNRKK